MAYTWHAIDLYTGQRGPQFQTSTRGNPKRIIGEATDLAVSVLCWDAASGAVPEWRQFTQPGRMMLLLVNDDDKPIWGGLILRRVANPSQWVDLSLVTLEAYLDRRYSGALSVTATEQVEIARQLIQATVAAQGIPFVIDAQATGQLRDRTYADADDKTTLSLLTDLLNISNGIEFTCDLEWTDPTNTVLSRIMRVRSRVGTALANPVRFEYGDDGGSLTSFEVIEDYSSDNGANDVIAVSSGEGDARPQSAHMVNVMPGWVRYERRFTPSTSIIEQATLDAYASAELTRTVSGLTQISLVADLDSGPQLNRDWWLGDNITASITAPAYPERLSSDGDRMPGYERTVRVVGWEMDLDARTLTPTVRELS